MPITYRRLRSLVFGLPAESNIGRETSDTPPEWGVAEELLATLIESIDVTNRILYQANAAEDAPKVWDPIKVPRPTDKPKVRRSATAAELGAFLDLGELGDLEVEVRSNEDEGAASSLNA